MRTPAGQPAAGEHPRRELTMNDPTADRQRRFEALWERLGGARAGDATHRHAELETLYARPDRHYHTTRDTHDQLDWDEVSAAAEVNWGVLEELVY